MLMQNEQFCLSLRFSPDHLSPRYLWISPHSFFSALVGKTVADATIDDPGHSRGKRLT
jgi:hypothetical protein